MERNAISRFIVTCGLVHDVDKHEVIPVFFPKNRDEHRHEVPLFSYFEGQVPAALRRRNAATFAQHMENRVAKGYQ